MTWSRVTAGEVGRREGSEIHSEGKINKLSCWMDVGREKKREVISASEAFGLSIWKGGGVISREGKIEAS